MVVGRLAEGDGVEEGAESAAVAPAPAGVGEISMDWTVELKPY